MLPCVSETTIEGLSAAYAWQRTMSAGRCAWIKLCIGSLLHCPFSVSLCYTCPPESSHPVSSSTSGDFFRRSWPSPLQALCQCSFVRSGWDSAHCVSLYTHRAQLFTDWLCERSKRAKTEGGGTGGQWILSPQNKPKCKQGEQIFERRPLNCATNRMSTVVALFGLGEK